MAQSDGFPAPRRAVLSAMGAGMAGLMGGAAAAQALPSPGPAAPWTGGGSVKRSGGRIAYVTLGEGSGEPVVLLPKLGGEVADWRKVAPLIAASGRRVIAIDLPGHGGSTLLGTPPHIHTVPETVSAIKAALSELGVERCAIVGNSLGGIVGILMAALWPRSVSRLGLVSVSLSPALTRAQVDALDAKVRANFGPRWGPLPRPPADVAEIGFRDPEVLREDNASRARTGVWLRPAERGVGLVGVADYLPRLQCPVLMMLTDSGHYVKYGATAKALIKDVEVVTVPGSGSFIHMEKPAETAALLNGFLAQV